MGRTIYTRTQRGRPVWLGQEIGEHQAGDVELLPDGSEKIWTAPNAYRIRSAQQILDSAMYLAQQLTVDKTLSPQGISPQDYSAAQKIVAGMPVVQAVTQAQQQAGVMPPPAPPPAPPGGTEKIVMDFTPIGPAPPQDALVPSSVHAAAAADTGTAPAGADTGISTSVGGVPLWAWIVGGGAALWFFSQPARRR